MSELKFSPGKAVEVSLDAEDSLDIWYPATVIKETGKGSFVVEYNRSDEGGPLQVVVDSHRIRPSPPACVNATFQLLEKVDAFCNFGWSSGVVTKVLADGRYIVYFKRTRKEKELRHMDLRLPMAQTHGKGVHSSQGTAVITNTQETKDKDAAGGNGKISSPLVNPGIVKESEEVRNGQKEKSVSVSSMKIEGDVKNKPAIRKKPRRDKSFKELNAESAPQEVQSSLVVCETQMTQTEVKEKLDQVETLEVPISDVKENTNTRMEQSENGKQANSKSASPRSSLEASEEKFETPTNSRTPFRGKSGRGRGRVGRPPASVSKSHRVSVASPRASVAGAAATDMPVTIPESLLGFIGKPIVISLPCYTNSQWNILPPQPTSKLPTHSLTAVQEEKEQLPHEEKKKLPQEEKNQRPQEEKNQRSQEEKKQDGHTVNTLNHGRPETKGLNNENSAPRRKRGRPFASASAGLNNENSTPRRKRGRPFGSFSGIRKSREKETEEGIRTSREKETEEVVVTILSSSSRRKSTRERREVYKSAIDSLKPRVKKPRTTTEVSTPTQEEKDEAVITYSVTEYVEPVSHGVSGNMSDDDRPLSTWFGEAHSLPNHTKPIEPILGDNDSQSGKLVEKTDQILTIQRKEETTGGSDVDLALSASRDEVTTRESEGEKQMDLVVKDLPFSKISPIWKVIESMEVFQQIPQNPHFQPLYATKEHCREGLAICSMVTFSRLVEDISKFQFDDPRNILEDSEETLSDLERQGFNVEPIRSRLNALLTLKSGHDEAQSFEKEIAQEQKEKAIIDQELAEIERKIAELREKQALVELEVEKKDSKIDELQSRFDPVREALEAARSEFGRLVSAPW